MKPHRPYPCFQADPARRLTTRLLPLGAALMALTFPAVHAADIVMTGSDAVGQNSFTNGDNFPGSLDPVAGNTYRTGAFRLRTFTNALSYTFAGDSLEIQAGLGWRIKNSGTNTVGNLILADLAILELSQPNGQTGVAAVGTLAGNITLNGTAVLMAGNNADGTNHVFTVSSSISGSGGLTTGNAALSVASGVPAQSNGTVILTGDNSFTGGMATGGLAGSKLRLGNANAVKNSTLTVGVAGGLTFSSGIGTFNLGGLAGAQDIALTDILSNPVTLSVGGGVNNNSAAYSGMLSGAGGLTKSGSGTQTLSGANTFTGLTTVSNGSLVASGNNSLQNTSGVTVTTGGTLLLAGAGDRINNAGLVTLSGGRLHTDGLSEGLGVLSVGGADSVIDMGGGTSVLTFANSSSNVWAGGGTLSIWNWTGSLTGGGTDQLLFSAGGLTSGQIASVSFLNPAGFAEGTYGATLLGSGELVPVPEPGPLAALCPLLGLIGWRAGRSHSARNRRR